MRGAPAEVRPAPAPAASNDQPEVIVVEDKVVPETDEGTTTEEVVTVAPTYPPKKGLMERWQPMADCFDTITGLMDWMDPNNKGKPLKIGTAFGDAWRRGWTPRAEDKLDDNKKEELRKTNAQLDKEKQMTEKTGEKNVPRMTATIESVGKVPTIAGPGKMPTLQPFTDFLADFSDSSDDKPKKQKKR
jgi:hypothetical protein